MYTSIEYYKNIKSIIYFCIACNLPCIKSLLEHQNRQTSTTTNSPSHIIHYIYTYKLSSTLRVFLFYSISLSVFYTQFYLPISDLDVLINLNRLKYFFSQSNTDFHREKKNKTPNPQSKKVNFSR